MTLGITNVSFVAQVPDWNPPLLYETIKAAHQHKGTGFVRILQRCPVYTPEFCKPLQDNPERMLLLTHENGIPMDPGVKRLFPEHREHDPGNWVDAMALARDEVQVPVGLLYYDPDAPLYDHLSSQGLNTTNEEKLAALNAALDRFAI